LGYKSSTSLLAMETGSSMAAPSATASVNVQSQKLWGWVEIMQKETFITGNATRVTRQLAAQVVDH